MTKKRRTILCAIVTMFFICWTFYGCGRRQQSEKALQQDSARMEKIMERADALAPKQPDKALVIYRHVAFSFDHLMGITDREMVATACLNISNIMISRHQYNEALSTLFRAQSISEDLPSSLLRVRIMNNIATIHLLNKNYHEASYLYEKTYADFGDSLSNDKKRPILCNLVTVNIKLGNVGKARRYLALYNRLGITRGSSRADYQYSQLVLKGGILRLEKKYQASLHTLDNALRYSHRLQMPPAYTCDALEELAYTAQAEGDTQAIRRYLERLYDTAKRENVEEKLLAALHLLPKVYEELGDTVNAQRYYTEYCKVNDRIMNAYDYNRINSHHAYEQSERLLSEIIMLKADKLAERNKAATLRLLVIVVSCFLLLTLIAVFIILRQKRKLEQSYSDLFQLNLQQEKNDEVMQRRPRITDDQMQGIAEKISRVMTDEHEFCDPDFSLQRLAELVGSNTWYVSKVINDMYHKNFRAFVNEYRIKEVKKRMTDPHYGKLTLQALAESVGFRSMSTFSTVFKQNVRMTPSLYMKEALSHLRKNAVNLE